MHIVGFTGPIHHGKTTAAKMLLALEPKSKHIESWYVIAEVAQKLNEQFDPSLIDQRDVASINSWLFHLLDILPAVLDLKPSFDQIELHDHEIEANSSLYNKLFVYIDRLIDNPELAKEEITDDNKEEHRPLLQWLGEYIPHCLGDSVWYDEIMKRISAHSDDLKLHTISGLRYPADAATVRRHSGSIIEINRPDYIIADQSDPTEASRKLIEADAVVMNNGNIEDLEKAMQALWVDIQASRIRYEYRAVN